MKKFCLLPIFIIAPVITFAVPKNFKSYKTGYLTNQIYLNSFSSSTNYNREGYTEPLITNGSFSANDFGIFSRLPLSPRWGLSGGIMAAAVESNNNTEVRTNSGLSTLYFATDYRIASGSMDFISEFEFGLPIYRVDPATDSSLISEGDLFLGANLILQSKTRRQYSYAHAGFRYRDEGRAMLLPYRAGMFFLFGRWVFGGEVRGFTPVSYDEQTDSPQKKSDVTQRVNAGSYKFYSVNPASSEIEGSLRYFFSKDLSFSTGIGSTFAGTSSAYGTNLFVSLQFGWQMFNRKSSSNSIKQKKALEYFEESIEEDPSLDLFEQEDLDETERMFERR